MSKLEEYLQARQHHTMRRFNREEEYRNLPDEMNFMVEYDPEQLMEHYEKRNSEDAEFQGRVRYYFTDSTYADTKAERYRKYADDDGGVLSAHATTYTNRGLRKRKSRAQDAADAFDTMSEKMDQLRRSQAGRYEKYLLQEEIMKYRLKGMTAAAKVKGKSKEQEEFLISRAELSCRMVLKDQLSHLIAEETDVKQKEKLQKKLTSLEKDIQSAYSDVQKKTPTASELWRQEHNLTGDALTTKFIRNKQDNPLTDKNSSELKSNLEEMNRLRLGGLGWPATICLMDRHGEFMTRGEADRETWNNRYARDRGNAAALKILNDEAIKRFEAAEVPTPEMLKGSGTDKYVKEKLRDYVELTKGALGFYRQHLNAADNIGQYMREHPKFLKKLIYLDAVDRFIDFKLRSEHMIRFDNNAFVYENEDAYKTKIDANGKPYRDNEYGKGQEKAEFALLQQAYDEMTSKNAPDRTKLRNYHPMVDGVNRPEGNMTPADENNTMAELRVIMDRVRIPMPPAGNLADDPKWMETWLTDNLEDNLQEYANLTRDLLLFKDYMHDAGSFVNRELAADPALKDIFETALLLTDVMYNFASARYHFDLTDVKEGDSLLGVETRTDNVTQATLDASIRAYTTKASALKNASPDHRAFVTVRREESVSANVQLELETAQEREAQYQQCKARQSTFTREGFRRMKDWMATGNLENCPAYVERAEKLGQIIKGIEPGGPAFSIDRYLYQVMRPVHFDKRWQPISDTDQRNHAWNIRWLDAWIEDKYDEKHQMIREQLPNLYLNFELPPMPTAEEQLDSSQYVIKLEKWVEKRLAEDAYGFLHAIRSSASDDAFRSILPCARQFTQANPKIDHIADIMAGLTGFVTNYFSCHYGFDGTGALGAYQANSMRLSEPAMLTAFAGDVIRRRMDYEAHKDDQVTSIDVFIEREKNNREYRFKRYHAMNPEFDSRSFMITEAIMQLGRFPECPAYQELYDRDYIRSIHGNGNTLDRDLTSMMKMVHFDEKWRPLSEEDEQNHQWNLRWLKAFKDKNQEAINAMIDEQYSHMFDNMLIPPMPTEEQKRNPEAYFEVMKAWVEHDVLPNLDSFLFFRMKEGAIDSLKDMNPALKARWENDNRVLATADLLDACEFFRSHYCRDRYHLNKDETGPDKVPASRAHADRAHLATEQILINLARRACTLRVTYEGLKEVR